MDFHCARADPQIIGDRLVGQSVDQTAENFALPIGQYVEARTRFYAARTRICDIGGDGTCESGDVEVAYSYESKGAFAGSYTAPVRTIDLTDDNQQDLLFGPRKTLSVLHNRSRRRKCPARAAW